MNAVERHPPKDQLVAFGLGKLDPREAEQVAGHICDCPDCSETIELQDDSFVAMVRDSPALQPVDDISLAATSDKQSHRRVAVDVTTESNHGTCDLEGLPLELREHPRYQIIGLIGKGGMGDVYEARHRMMDRTVALKIINREFVRKPEAVDRFHREVKTAARLTHPNIVTAHDAEQAGDVHFLVMEYVDGVDLARAVKKQGALTVADACDYVRQAAIGLQYAHEMGMVHRDIKPHNLMVTAAGTVKILDFGLASLAPDALSQSDTLEAHSDLTSAGSIMGTPDFISPEQADSASQADTRSDIYSLGTTLYYLLSGRPPFAEGSVMHKLKSHALADPEPIDSLRDDIPKGLVSVLKRMLAKDPADRYQTPSQVADALKPFGHRRQLAVATNEIEVTPVRTPSRRLATLAAVFIALVGLGTVGVAWLGGLFEDDGMQVAKKLGQADDGVKVPDVLEQDDEGIVATDEHDQGESQDVGRPQEDPSLPPPPNFVDNPVQFRRLVGHQGPVSTVAISPSGRWAASCSGGGGSKGPTAVRDGTICIWDLITGEVLHELKGPSDDIRGLAFTPDGEHLLTGARHRKAGQRPWQLQLWNVETGQEVRQLEGGASCLKQLAFIDHQRAFTCHEDRIIIWDIPNGTEIATFSQPFVASSADVHLATSRVAIGGNHAAIRILDLRDASEIRTLKVPDDQGWPPIALGVAFSPDGLRLAAGVFMQGTLIWDINSGKHLHTIRSGVDCVLWTKDGRYVIGGGDSNWFIYDTQENEIVAKRELAFRVYSIALAPDGRSVLLGGGPRWHYPEDRDFALQHWRLPKQLWPLPKQLLPTHGDAESTASSSEAPDAGDPREVSKRSSEK